MILNSNCLTKAILYEAEELRKTDKDSIFPDNLRTLSQIVSFYVATLEYWKYEIKINMARQIKSTHEERMSWLDNNNIKFWSDPSFRNEYVYKFINEDDAMAFKLRFTDENSDN